MQIFGIPALTDSYENYIWVLTENAHAWVIDPGEATPVINFLEAQNLTLNGILITHRHGDHVNGVQALCEHFQMQNSTLEVWGPEKSPLAFLDHRLSEGDSIELFDHYQLHVLETPGHTEDHIAFYNSQHLFCGDTLFTGGCGKILGGTAAQFAQSILKLRDLPDSTEFYCAHEYTADNLAFAILVDPENRALQQRLSEFHCNYPNQALTQAPSTLGLEKATNPFLRFDASALQTKLFGQAIDKATPAEQFAKLRTLKDQFDQTGKIG